MIRALVVDDSPGILMHHVRGLESRLGAQVFAASNGQEAIAVLETSPIDIVVTDLSMPVMDGFALLAYLKRSYPNLPVIIATSMSAPGLDANLFRHGALPILKKPVDAEHLATVVERVLTEAGQGHLSGITLPSFLQLLTWERKSCALFIHHNGRQGRLHFLSGELVNAYTFENHLEGEDAAKEILSWSEVDVELERSHHNHQRLIDTPLEKLLLEAARLNDERTPQPFTQGDKDDLTQVADAALAVLDRLLSAPVPQHLLPQNKTMAKADKLQVALVSLLERACRAEEALAEVMQAVAVLLEQRQSEKPSLDQVQDPFLGDN